MEELKNKVFILGLDGGTWKILDPLLQKGLMPNLKKMVEEGTKGTLRSTVPPLTPPAWTSFQTGVNPGKHGIFDFLGFDPTKKKTYVVNSNSIPLKTIWDIASNSGKKVITVNVPLTYPPKREPNRITIGCMLSPKENVDIVWPKEIFEKYIKRSGYKILGAYSTGSLKDSAIEAIINEATEVERARIEVSRRLMADYPWDLFMLQIQSTDHVQHFFSHYLDPDSPDFGSLKYALVSKF
ncbi:MAG: alkaline phosphatase family protein, partial [Candidatus Omnitrophica bacterium]|nr:alkaline phosphatase family protein [Candidatus Omnitrophota bacterium]